MARPLMPDQRFLDRMYGIHSPFQYRLMEHKYGPSVETWPGAAVHKPRPFLEMSLDPIVHEQSISPRVENQADSRSFDPFLNVLFDLAKKNKDQRCTSPLGMPWLNKNEEKTSTTSWALPSITSNQVNETVPSWIPDISIKREKKDSVVPWSLPSFDKSDETDATPFISTNRKTCYACSGTGEPPGITGIWRDRCWACEGLGYHETMTRHTEPKAFHSILRPVKEVEEPSNLSFSQTSSDSWRRESNHMFPETESLAPMHQKCRKCGRNTFWATCVECDSKEFWRSINEDDDYHHVEYEANDSEDDYFKDED